MYICLYDYMSICPCVNVCVCDRIVSTIFHWRGRSSGLRHMLAEPRPTPWVGMSGRARLRWATVDIMDGRAMLRVDVRLYEGISLWALLESCYGSIEK